MDDLIRLNERAAARFGELLHSVGDRDVWADPTPDEEWTVRDLVNHVVNEALWMPALIGGETIEQVGDRFDGDQIGAHPAARWDEVAEALRSTLAEASMELTIPLSYGPTPLPDYLAEFTTDVVIHGWDLARAIGADDTIEPSLLEPVLERCLAQEEGIRNSGLVGPRIEAPEGADDQTVLLAIWGRQR